jgi:hypothetical protein
LTGALRSFFASQCFVYSFQIAERHRVAGVVHRLKQHGELWQQSEDKHFGSYVRMIFWSNAPIGFLSRGRIHLIAKAGKASAGWK